MKWDGPLRSKTVRRNKFVYDQTGTMPMSKMCVAVTSHRINKSTNLLLGTGHKVCALGGGGGVEGIPKFYHKIWHPPPKSVGKYLIPPSKEMKCFVPPPPSPAHPTNHPLPKNIEQEHNCFANYCNQLSVLKYLA